MNTSTTIFANNIHIKNNNINKAAIVEGLPLKTAILSKNKLSEIIYKNVFINIIKNI